MSPVMAANVVAIAVAARRVGRRYGLVPMGATRVVPLVHGPRDVTAAWCDVALADRLGGAHVTEVRLEPVGTGQVADTVRIHLAYDRRDAGPPTLVAKIPSADETSFEGARATRTYEIEASFYRDLAAALPVRTPVCWYAHHDAETNAYIVVLEDVAPAAQGDQMRGCTVADIEAAIDELVLLHGPRWGDPTLLDIAWLHRSTPDVTPMVGLLELASVPFRERYGDRLDADTVALVDRFLPKLAGYLSYRPAPWTIVHVDFRADNLLFGLDRVVVVDWQTVNLGPGPGDLAYLLGASLRPEDRRSAEHGLVDRYVAGLRAQGVPVDRDDVWQLYRHYAFSGLVMAIVASFLVRQTERGDEMFMTMASRHARQALDLDSESLLH
jgi:Phosphotransferase enzyme family